jgi:hypothetical protein
METPWMMYFYKCAYFLGFTSYYYFESWMKRFLIGNFHPILEVIIKYGCGKLVWELVCLFIHSFFLRRDRVFWILLFVVLGTN